MDLCRSFLKFMTSIFTNFTMFLGTNHELKISPEAKNDLAEIKRYISQELYNSQAAVKLCSKIMKKIRRLSEYPEIGTPLSSIIDIQTDYRFLVCVNFYIKNFIW